MTLCPIFILHACTTLTVHNRKVWTVTQYVNLNYVPVMYRVLVGNFVALGWNVYLALQS